MFDLGPITTSNLFTLAQIVVILIGFIFSWMSLAAARKSIDLAAQNLGVATANNQAQLYNQMTIQGRDLQFKFMDLYLKDDLTTKQDLFIGTLLAYYSACYELRRLFTLPASVIKLLDNDLRELLRQDQVRRKWDQIRHLHSREFNEYVDSLRGV